MTNWWEELKLENKTEDPVQVKMDRLQAEVERLRAVNTRLLAASKEAYIYVADAPGARAFRIARELEEAIADAQGQPNPPAGPKLPGLE